MQEWEKKEVDGHFDGMSEAKITDSLIFTAHPYRIGEEKESGYKGQIYHFIRHGQGLHNLEADRAGGCKCPSPSCPYLSPSLKDPVLTDLGKDQAATIASSFEHEVDIIVSSPLTRALQTASIALERHWREKAVPFITLEECHEQGGVHVCDERRDTVDLLVDFPHVNFSHVGPTDPLKSSTNRESRIEVARRAYTFMERVTSLPHERIVVASHSSWLLTLFNTVLECEDKSLLRWFATGELRSVVVEVQTRKK